jgi:hypothetical protein
MNDKVVNRRAFVGLLAAGTGLPLIARAQQGGGTKRIAVLQGNPDDPPAQARVAAFRQGLLERNWQEGRNLRIDIRWGAAMPIASRPMPRSW